MTSGAVEDPATLRLGPWLSRLVDFERMRPTARAWDLANMHVLLAEDSPAGSSRPAAQRAVQVGGSKGKGTTCAFLAALARAAGLRVGVYTSPHLHSMCERVVVDGAPITVDELQPRFVELVEFGAARGLQLTFFEVMTAVARRWFVERAVDLAVYEVGLGGRFDATTALAVDASVVTGIELEHTEILGDTVAAIAAEKAPVIRAGGHGFTAATGEALAVIERHAADVGASLAVLGRDVRLVDGHLGDDGYRGTLELPGGAVLPVHLPDSRGFEPPALALAAAVARSLWPDLPLDLDPAPRPGVAGRFEVVRCPDGAPLVFDVAHTIGSLAAVAAEVARRWPGRRAALLFAAAAGKRWREGLSRMLPTVDSIVVTELSGTVGEDPATIADWLQQQGRECSVERDLGRALQSVLRRPGPRLVVGSFYLVGRARSLLERRRHA